MFAMLKLFVRDLRAQVRELCAQVRKVLRTAVDSRLLGIDVLLSFNKPPTNGAQGLTLLNKSVTLRAGIAKQLVKIRNGTSD
jgi:hypothetical protein